MKSSKVNNNSNSTQAHEVIKPISIKMPNINLFDSYDNYLPENISLPDSLSEKEIEALKERNKKFYNDYLKICEENSLLKFKLQDLTNKKNEIHKYLIQLEHRKEINLVENENNMNIINNGSNNLINKELINFQSNIYINRKRKRRKKSQIICNYKCSNCNKKYATEGALNQHIKFKHKNIKK